MKMWGDHEVWFAQDRGVLWDNRAVGAGIRSQAKPDELVILEERDLWPQRDRGSSLYSGAHHLLFSC